MNNRLNIFSTRAMEQIAEATRIVLNKPIRKRAAGWSARPSFPPNVLIACRLEVTSGDGGDATHKPTYNYNIKEFHTGRLLAGPANPETDGSVRRTFGYRDPAEFGYFRWASNDAAPLSRYPWLVFVDELEPIEIGCVAP